MGPWRQAYTYVVVVQAERCSNCCDSIHTFLADGTEYIVQAMKRASDVIEEQRHRSYSSCTQM